MSVIFLLIMISITVAVAFLMAFLWAVKDGQFEDDYSPAVRMLFDDEVKTPLDAENSRLERMKKEENTPV